MDNLHLYAFLMHVLSFNLARVNLNYDLEFQTLFNKCRVGVIGGGCRKGQAGRSLMSLTIMPDLIWLKLPLMQKKK